MDPPNMSMKKLRASGMVCPLSAGANARVIFYVGRKFNLVVTEILKGRTPSCQKTDHRPRRQSSNHLNSPTCKTSNNAVHAVRVHRFTISALAVTYRKEHPFRFGQGSIRTAPITPSSFFTITATPHVPYKCTIGGDGPLAL